MQIDVDRAPASDPAADLGIASRIVASRHEAAIDLAELRRRLRPAALRRGAGCNEVRAKDSLELARERDRISRREERTQLAVLKGLGVRGNARGDHPGL